ncbi:endoribonuclease Dicer-like [Rhopalosiphum maidis]|uniref:endoribonuclease Dicer-like n=1 Tax=Rhopalosiphum maidis TaxID=43146 RepID=UPI000F004C83|nr:endoribonuclease Dicer-like [Rhopalosiphum maidis]
MDQPSKDTSSVVPRDDQLELLELFESIKKSNTILYLPTGSGKTYLVTLLIKHLGESLTKPKGEGRKWTFFIVQSVPLANQYADNLRGHLPWNICTISDHITTNDWTQMNWDKILEKCHILIMTANIYLNNLYYGYMEIKDANLLIFDECHYAVLFHPFKKIMEIFHDSDLKSDERPHILGLTATLINKNTKNVRDELIKLQSTFNSTIKTKCIENIQIFSACPREFISFYDEYILDDELKVVTNRISTMLKHLRCLQSSFKAEKIKECDEIYYLEHQKQSNDLSKFLIDIMTNLVDGGPYIAFLATWHFLVEIEKKKKICHDMNKLSILYIVLSEVTLIRKLLYDYMNKHASLHNDHTTTLNNVSPKLTKLMQHLSTLKSTDACLIFVDSRSTAKILYHYIKDYTQEYNQNNIVCDFIFGARGIMNTENNELKHKKQQNNDIIKKFNDNTINVLVSTEVFEDGVNIKTCNFIIRFDSPKTFFSYIQSKGKACSSESTFIIMVQNSLNFKNTQSEYMQIEEEIKNVLVKNDIDEENINENITTVFKSKHATLTYENAFKILHRYCLSLPQDRFSNLYPEWYITQSNNQLKKYKLILPINSAIKTPIDGSFNKTKKNAKRSAAYNTCIELYKVGALDEYFMPVDSKNNAAFNDLKWFPHWDDNDIEPSKYNLKAGTAKMKRTMSIKNTTHLHGSYPMENKPTYLHVIHCTPNYAQLKDSKNEIFDQLLKSNKEYGILTINKLPQVSSFPIFLPFGNVNVSIKVNVDIIYLESESLKKLDDFHNKLFVDILGVKCCLARNYDNEKNSYLVVPIFSTDNTYKLDWNVININKLIETEKPTMEQRLSKFYEKDLKIYSVITPWYRSVVQDKNYVVTEILFDMSPESSFPSSTYDTYAEYFSDKYNINVTRNDQPLIKVRSLGQTKTNYLVPRISTDITVKRKEYNEILIPEFCIWHKCPSVYWLKALMLPTILYRFEQLLLAEELIVKINSICNIEVDDNELNNDTLDIDHFCGFYENKKKKKNIILAVSEILKYSQENNMVDDWNSGNLSIDIDRQKNTTMLDILNYFSLIHKDKPKNSDDITNIQQSNYSSNLNEMEMDDVFKKALTAMNTLILTKNAPPMLSPLFKKASKQSIALKKSDMLKIITPPLYNDMFNYERMETYGDSFLKFAVSLVLYDAFPLDNEGVLSVLKTKIVGNQNLFYVGRNLNLGSYLMLNVFESNMDWIPPCFGIPEEIKKIIKENNCSLEVIHQIIISKSDQITGVLSDETLNEIKKEIFKFKQFSTSYISDKDAVPDFDHSLSDLFMHNQTVADKMVADCVESLIGTYVYNCGVEVGFKVLHGLGIIPKQFIDTFNPQPTENVRVGLNFSNLLPGYELLEERIGYSFKNKYLLVQALTHPTYSFGSIDCYQRLEFLGDAILDFLITTYIIEHCHQKTPGEITDIRSSLVNNITFSSLSIRIGLHRFILAKSLKMTEAIDRFYKNQQKNNFKIGQEVLYLIEENDCYAAESIDVPKVLGDLFEALIAAIYLDCNRDLNFVWTLCYRFLENEIKEFCTNIPKNPLRILHETKLSPNFSIPDAADQSLNKGLGTMMKLQITLNQKVMNIYGFGHNKKEAKVAAAKLALKNMKKIM